LHKKVQLPFVFALRLKRRYAMSKENNGSLSRRIRTGKLTKEDVARRLAELAFGKANDCVRLVLEEGTPLGRLDLSLLSEVKRNEKGTVEVKLVDRLRALEQLALLAQENGEDLEEFLKALQGDEGI
jgi:hypothetical protein